MVGDNRGNIATLDTAWHDPLYAGCVKIAVLASGSGTILDAMVKEGIEISLVLVDRPCGAEKLAAGHKIALSRCYRTDFSARFDRTGYSARVARELEESGIELIAMAGYGTVLELPVHQAFPGRILNTHPSLLPAFAGWHAVRDALAYGVRVTGCTVHLATLAVDAGPILAQEAVRIEIGDTEEILHERIKQVERVLYPATLSRFAAFVAAGAQGDFFEFQRDSSEAIPKVAEAAIDKGRES